MKKVIWKNIIMNSIFAIIFVILNNWILQKNLEETFVLLSLIYGIAVVLVNALFVARFCKK